MSSIPTPQTQTQTTDHDDDLGHVSPRTQPETERERIRAAAREAAAQFPPMSGELVTLVRNTLRGRTR
ncbi:hypothetical protein [Brevibacterium sp. CS2]|uniref:hypothetical protein n=1 Tax=Brevibacterium sp. CS2 TaxID=2575923 RepID=UPI0010C7DF61|nr:hypothetical protein [Brevibacterium sp. CS2]QCP05609.1 hypothetical protein FDF13_10200 [Brevibacterium sp. CS2]